jgi:hypothetical protein
MHRNKLPRDTLKNNKIMSYNLTTYAKQPNTY